MLPDAVYLLPLRRTALETDVAELGAYLAQVADVLPVVVADGSPPSVRAAHAAVWGPRVRVVPVPAPLPGANGKVVGVLAGLAATTAEHVVVADDDVRHDGETLRRAVALLACADAVVPQNVYDPLPWQARWDTSRSLLNRALGSDYPGTLAFRRSALGPGGYDPRVLFENLELLRTVTARGGRVHHALDLYVTRRPPTVRKAAEQRVRQAYDSFAQPGRLAVELSILPVLAAALARPAPGRPRTTVPALLALTAVVLAEAGRRRAGGRSRFPATAALWAPLWVAERAVCSWLALGWRLRGGVPYAGTRLRTAAHSVHHLRRLHRGAPAPRHRPDRSPDHEPDHQPDDRPGDHPDGHPDSHPDQEAA
ncbi:glycosyltransferase family 2 protein [Xylanimonas oleitrophica]|uniref:Glycosyltransferase family 2 protein n=1 Tax=Xylanimonas oleitrophica TaxID=2607479 RepID=A0A2W5WQP8_9MICO|nr:glycosyltransferase [Xylanimonas oleitrophica]PZR53869.1 glycosyltransferase family 2 protein [Xylanimonas oleitrophica]